MYENLILLIMKKQQGINWQLKLWFITVLLLTTLFTAIFTAWVVKRAIIGGPRLSYTQRQFVLWVAKIPRLVWDAGLGFYSICTSKPILAIMDRKSVEKPCWVRRFPAPEDPGYLLFAGIDSIAKHSVVKLIRIADGKKMAVWDPDWKAIYEITTNKKFSAKGNFRAAFARHPLLLPDGDIIFNSNSAMVRLGPYSSKPVWVLDEVLHHSNEIGVNGEILVPSIFRNPFPDNPWLNAHIKDDALAQVSTDGKLLQKFSFSKILIDNGLGVLLFGMNGFHFAHDPIHINHIKAALSNTRYWKRGDWLISARNLSAIFLYRPSTGRIVWHQTGPWMNQHYVDFVDDHRISVFSNNVFSGAPDEQPFVKPNDVNRVFVYDFKTKQASEPFADLLAIARPITITEGCTRVLPDGGLFVEETNSGRILRFKKDQLLWSLINDYDNNYIGTLSWSRYLTADEAKIPLKALASRQCKKANDTSLDR
jgi:hypothetical protein